MKFKHLETFESYSSINEEESLLKKTRGFITGHETKSDEIKAKENIMKELDEFDKEVAKDPSKYIYNRESIEKNAKENRYRGRVTKRASRTSNKYIIAYQDVNTKLSELGSGSSSGRR